MIGANWWHSELQCYPIGATSWALPNQRQIQWGKGGLSRSGAGLQLKLAICSYLGILSRCVLGPGCSGGFSTSDSSLWIAGRRETLREDANTRKARTVRACGVVTGKGGRPWLRQCFSPPRAPSLQARPPLGQLRRGPLCSARARSS
jgi:hypothetical protein